MKTVFFVLTMAFLTSETFAYSMDLNKHIICTSSVESETLVLKIASDTVMKSKKIAAVETNTGVKGKATWVESSLLTMNLDTNAISLSPTLTFSFSEGNVHYRLLLQFGENMTGVLHKGKKDEYLKSNPVDGAVACVVD
jgi:hypothetical protein